jgi:hypothetical protein
MMPWRTHCSNSSLLFSGRFKPGMGFDMLPADGGSKYS